MKRALWIASLAAVSLAGTPAAGQTPLADPPVSPTAPVVAPQASPPAPATVPSGTAPNGTAPGATSVPDPWAGGPELDAERKAIWESPEMVEAREYIRQYSLRSRAFTPEQAQQYVAQLRQMSPGSMTEWLEKFRAMQARRLKAEEVARRARQTAVEESVRRLQMVQESYAAASEGTADAALHARNELARQQQFRDAATAARRSNRNAFVADALTNPYDWIINPDWYTKWAASASLPGDLPRSDPRNFIRGDVTEPIVDGGIEGPAGAAAAAAAAAGANTAPPVPTPGGG